MNELEIRNPISDINYSLARINELRMTPIIYEQDIFLKLINELKLRNPISDINELGTRNPFSIKVSITFPIPHMCNHVHEYHSKCNLHSTWVMGRGILFCTNYHTILHKLWTYLMRVLSYSCMCLLSYTDSFDCQWVSDSM